MNALAWTLGKQPLAPGGLLIYAGQFQPALKRLLSMDDELLAGFRGVYNPELMVVIGAEENLPWIPGAVYLGHSRLAPHLWLPTHMTPSISIDLLDSHVCQQWGPGEYVIEPRHKAVIPLAAALPLRRDVLEAIDVER